MTKGTKFLLLAALAVCVLGLVQEPAWADKVQEAIAAAPQGTEKGQIDATQPVG